MMGYGFPYDNYYGGGGSSSSASNLSASAPPFTVTKPLLDLTEPSYPVSLNPSLQNWVPSNSHMPNSRPDLFPFPNPEFDPMSSPNALGYSPPISHVPPMIPPLVSAPSDAVMYGQSKSNLFEAEPYYPSYVPPATGSDIPLKIPHQPCYDVLSISHVGKSNGSSCDKYTSSLLGLEHTTQWSSPWEGVTDWHRSKKMQLDGGLCGKENYMNQEFSSFRDRSTCEETSHGFDMVGRQMIPESASRGQLDYESILGEKPKFTSTDHPTLPSFAFTAGPEIYLEVQPSNAVNSPNNQMLHIASYGKSPRKRDASPNDKKSTIKSSPAVVIRPPGQDTHAFNSINTGTDDLEKKFASKNSSFLQLPNPFISSEGKVHFDSSQIDFHLKQNDSYFAEISSKKNEELPRNKNVSVDYLDQIFRAKTDSKGPSRNLDSVNVALDGHEVIGSVENSSESLDHHNPSVDSPCWKGAPITHLSVFEVSEVVNPKNTKKLEPCKGLNPQGSHISPSTPNDAVKVCPEKKSESSVPHDHENLDNHVASSLKSPAVAGILLGERMKGAVRYEHCQMNPSYCRAAQISDDIDEPKKETILSDFDPLHTTQKKFEGEWPSKKNCSPGSDVADVTRKINDDTDDCSSHVPFHAIEQVLSSPPSSEHASNKHMQSHGGESMSKVHARTLVDTMHNLSELLLFYSPDGTSELKDEDFDVLKDVINNLDICLSKNLEKKTSMRESFFPQRATSQSPGKGQHVEGEEEQKLVSDKSKGKLSNSDSMRDAAADTVKNDYMTQAIKKVLAENFPIEEESESQALLYKNLWLEAEASLCSINYMARFNRMKIEMERCNPQKENENSLNVENLTRSKVVSDLFTNNKLPFDDEHSPVQDVSYPESSMLSRYSHSVDVTTRFHTLKNRMDNSSSMNPTVMEKLSSSMVSDNLNEVFKWANDSNDSAKPNASIQDLSISGMTSHADDYMPSLQILKYQVDGSNPVDTSAVEKLSGSKVSLDLNKVDSLAHDVKDGMKPNASFRGSSSNHADDVMARFRILKHRIDNSNSVDTSAVEKFSSSKVSPDLNTIDKLAHDTQDRTGPKASIRDAPMSGRSTDADYVMAKLRILNRRFDNSNPLNTSSVEKFSGSKASSDLDKVGNLSDEAKDGKKQDSPASSHAEDIEAAVMARLNILKQRDGNSSFIDMEEHRPEGIDIRSSADLRRQVPMGKDGLMDSSLDVNMEPVGQNYPAGSTTDKSDMKEFRLFVNDDALTQSHLANRLGDPPHAGWYDNTSSDWEHVLKEEIAGHGC